MTEERLQEITKGNSRGKQVQTDTTKKKKRKTQKCEKRLNKNDDMKVNEANGNHEKTINLKESNDSQIKGEKCGELIEEEKSKEVSEHNATKVASTNNSSRFEQQAYQKNAMSKGKATSKALQPILLPTVPSLSNAKSDEWATKVGFKRLLCQNWVGLA